MTNFFEQERPSSFEVIQLLEQLKKNDIPWKSGRVMAYVYEPEPEAYALIQKAYMMFLTENGLDPTAFSSLLKMEQEVIDAALQLVGGTEQSAGNFTFGGTESIILAVKAARDYARDMYPHIKQPNIVLAETGHAAFFKACHYLCLETKVIPVDAETFTPNPEDYRNAIDENTVMVVASTPSYAHGVIDPVEDIAKIAKEKGVLCHVDACVGGMYLPFAKRAGFDIPNFDFTVDGVTSISMDFHKYGYTAKGASAILYKDRELRKYQIYTCSSWSGYSVVNPTVLSSKTGGSLAACWANMNFIGAKGFEEIVKETETAKGKVVDAIKNMKGIRLLGKPIMNMVAFAGDGVDLFSLSKRMNDMGWYIQLQFKAGISPTNIHLSINRANVPHIDAFIEDLGKVVQDLLDNPPNDALPFPAEMLEGITPEMVQQLKTVLGVGDGEAPSDLTMVNRILDAVSPAKRDMILREFVNGLFR